jgi:hypothetical protein
MTDGERNYGKGAEKKIIERVLLPRVDIRGSVQMNKHLDRVLCHVYSDLCAWDVSADGGRTHKMVLVDGYSCQVSTKVEQGPKSMKNARL